MAFSEEGDSTTISVNEDAKNTSVKCISAEVLDEKASNVSI